MSFKTKYIPVKTLAKPAKISSWADISARFNLVNLATKKLQEILESCDDKRIVMQAIMYSIDRMYGRPSQSMLVHDTSSKVADWSEILASADDSKNDNSITVDGDITDDDDIV